MSTRTTRFVTAANLAEGDLIVPTDPHDTPQPVTAVALAGGYVFYTVRTGRGPLPLVASQDDETLLEIIPAYF